MKRYLVFIGDNYYPSGGWDDFAGYANNLEEAHAIRDSSKDSEWCQIVHVASGEVEKFYRKLPAPATWTVY